MTQLLIRVLVVRVYLDKTLSSGTVISIGYFFCSMRACMRRLLLSAGGAIVLVAQAMAQTSVTTDHILDYAPASRWQLSLAIGRAELQSPLSDGDHIELNALPTIKYYGERFYVENTSLGYSLYESPRFAVDLAGCLNKDGLFFPDSGNYLVQGFLSASLLGVDEDPRDVLDPPKRRLSYLGGFAVHWLAPVNISLGVYRDITGVHGGDEVPLTLSKRLVLGDFEVGLELGATYQSGTLVDYYYGADMATGIPESPQPIYHPGAALNTHTKLEGRYRLRENLSLVMAGRLDRLDEQIWQSPFVIRSETRSFLVGLQYVLW